MNKTFNMALAVAAAASLACAGVETPAAGYVDVAGTGAADFVSTPFLDFDGTAMTLADIDVTGLDPSATTIRVLNAKGKQVFKAVIVGGQWVDNDDNSINRGTNELVRGTSIQFQGKTGETLTFAGKLAEGGVPVTCVKGQNYVGNAAPVAKNLGSFVIGGSFDPWSDYVVINGVKYVYDGAWYTQSNYFGTGNLVSVNTTVTVPAGAGFRVYTPSAAGTTISIPGL